MHIVSLGPRMHHHWAGGPDEINPSRRDALLAMPIWRFGSWIALHLSDAVILALRFAREDRIRRRSLESPAPRS